MTNITTSSDELTPPQEIALKSLIEDGLPLVTHPYQQLAETIGSSESAVIQTIRSWLDDGLIKRWGIVVKHHSVGYTHNAMVVWDVPNHQVDEIGERIKASGLVSLCYRRPRRLPHWPYNLFCMIHGKNREAVMAQIERLINDIGLQHLSRDVLFSYKQYKQCGGHFLRRSVTPFSTSGHRTQHG
ncbi:MAG: Lrp/AsnC family transcriptional regulator [Hahellaceae bacterium]|nr:Lrp/AsnC family transcriptional regulator [Hahellaceae bacterium]MCP5169698.1 Lrp/AsnC family transcriptional regulator [Hahellaceae bacterium]